MKTTRFKILAVMTLCVLGSEANAQSIYTNPITGTNPNTSNPYTTGQTVDSNIVVTGIGRGTGIVGTNTNDRYNATTWNVANLSNAMSGNRYFTWTVTPSANYSINFGDITITNTASATGPGSWAFRSSLNNFGTSLASGGTGSAGGAGSVGTITDATLGSTFDTVTTSTEFRLYAFGASGSSGTYSVKGPFPKRCYAATA